MGCRKCVLGGGAVMGRTAKSDAPDVDGGALLLDLCWKGGNNPFKQAATVF